MENNGEKLDMKDKMDMFTTLHEHELKVKVSIEVYAERERE